jgi:predicted exporter
LTAGLAFGSLALCDLAALRQLGVLCGVGEVLTAVAILLVTPEIGALMERREPPPERVPAWRDAALAMTATRGRATAVLAVVGILGVAVGVVGWPPAGDALVAIRPRRLAPLTTQEAIYGLFGGRPGQWIVLAEDRDAGHAAARADAVAEALDPLARDGTLEGFDALASFAPADQTQRSRLAVRDTLNLPGLRPRLETALAEKGFDLEACAPALDAFAHPSSQIERLPDRPSGIAGWILARHLGRDEAGAVAATYVRPSGDPARDAKVVQAALRADPAAIITGYPRLEAALKESLARDLPRVAVVALLIVAAALRAILGSTRDVAIALATLVAEIAGVALLMRALHVPWHVYDALVLPVLLGVTIDEAMFLLHAAREGAAAGTPADELITRALEEQGSLVVATALTTAAGFAALLACRFEGLFDLGEVGVLGVLLGLVAALVVVPAGIRLGAPGTRPKAAPP